MTDGELVRRARAGQADALTELVQRWAGKVLALCHVQLRRPDVAHDIAQETLLRGIRSLSTLKQPEQFGPWLRSIAKRACLDWRKAKAQTTVPFSVLPPQCVEEQHAARNGKLEHDYDVDAMLHAVGQLSEEHREVILLYYYQKTTYQEMAKLLGVSSATINLRLTQARQLLRQRLIPQESST
jgi:RNA polymerase sigma-70 factor, ECF subfamily